MSDTEGIWTPPKEKRCLSDTLPFFRTKDQNLAGLKLILAHVMSLSNPWRSHRHPGTDVAMTIQLSMKALIGGWQVPDLSRGPLYSTSAALTNMFIPKANKDTDMEQPVMMLFSRQCHADVIDPEVNPTLKFL